MKALELTPTSWILTIRQGSVGLMRLNDGIYTVLGEGYSGTYKSIEAFTKKINIKLKFEKMLDDDSEKATVGTFPTKHNDVFDIKLGEIPSYTKRKGSTDRYAAGYYSIQFEKCCHSSFCPRVLTLESHTWQGPFKNKVEVDHAVKLINGK